MQFAYSPCSDTLQKAIFQAHNVDATAGKQWVALLDGSMLPAARLQALEQHFAVQASTVLDDTPLAAFGRQGPLILPIALHPSEVLKALTGLCSAIPALSFVVPRDGTDNMKWGLSWLALAGTDDGVGVHCRFADTRVTPQLLEALTPDQSAELSSVIDCWYWPNRKGHALDRWTLDITKQQDPAIAPFEQPLALNASQFARMLHAAEADMVFQMLCERMPEVTPSQPAGETHARIERMLLAAHARGLTDLPDLFQWVVVGFSTCDAFDQHPALTPVWQQHDPRAQRFGDWAQQWPEPVWKALAVSEQVQA